MPAVSVF